VKGIASLRMTLQPGERVELICRAEPRAAEGWNRLRVTERRRTIARCAGASLAAVGGWLLFPFLREAVAWAVIRFHIEGALIPLCYRIVGSPVLTAGFAATSWALPAGLMAEAQSRRAIRRLRSRFGDPYRLTRRTPGVEG
jgi:hypothetical protein